MNEERLTGSPFLTLRPLDADFSRWINTLGPLATVSRFPKGTHLSGVGDILTDIIFLVEGSILDSVANINGLEKCTLTFAPYPHWLFPAWHRMPLLYSSIAYTDVCLWHLPVDAFLNSMKTAKDFSSFIMHFCALESRRLYHQQYLQYAVPTTLKVAQVLSFYHYLRGQGAIPDLRLTQNLIAQLSGVHRTSVAQSLTDLRRKQLIHKQPESPLSDHECQALEGYAFSQN